MGMGWLGLATPRDQWPRGSLRPLDGLRRLSRRDRFVRRIQSWRFRPGLGMGWHFLEEQLAEQRSGKSRHRCDGLRRLAPQDCLRTDLGRLYRLLLLDLERF